MTRLDEGKSIKRVVKIHGVGDVNVEFTEHGITLAVPKTKKRLSLSWYQAVNAASTPSDVPSFLMGKPFEFLKYQAAKKQK